MEATITKTNPLGTERVGKLMMRYAVPSIISIVVNSLYNMVDQVFIGQGVGYLGNAATNVIMPVSTIMLAVGFMFGDGAAAFMSLHLGKKEPEKAAKGIGNMVAIVIGTGIVLMILFELFLTPLCRLFGATDNVLPYALDYGQIIVLGFPFSIICSAFGSPIRADGRPKISMVGLLIGCATNMILDPIFIFVCGWGVKGAAWATILGQVLNAIYFIICLFQFKTIKIKKEYFIPDVKVVGNIASLGTSSLISQIASVFVIAIMNNMLVKYGAVSKYGADIPLAALGVTMKVSQLITGVTLGIASGVQPILGYNYGSRQHDRVKSTLKWSLILGTAIMFAALFIFQVFPEQIIGIFGQESDLYVEFAVKCFRIYLLACFLIPSGAVVGIFFQAIGKPVPAAALTLSRQIILLIPAMLILGYTMGVEGILWAGPFSDALSGIIALITVKVFWKRIFENKGQKETAGR